MKDAHLVGAILGAICAFLTICIFTLALCVANVRLRLARLEESLLTRWNIVSEQYNQQTAIDNQQAISSTVSKPYQIQISRRESALPPSLTNQHTLQPHQQQPHNATEELLNYELKSQLQSRFGNQNAAYEDDRGGSERIHSLENIAVPRIGNRMRSSGNPQSHIPDVDY